jgi:hypothetical protein
MSEKDDAARQTELYQGIWSQDHSYGTAEADVIDTVVHRIGPHVMRACGDAVQWLADFGAGDGRFLKAMRRAGLCRLAIGVDVYMPERMEPGTVWCQKPLWDANVTADYVISTDTLEHMPAGKVCAVLARIAQCAPHGFLRIATKQDIYGTDRGLHLHETVQEPDWWLHQCRENGIEPSSWRVYPGNAVEVWF